MSQISVTPSTPIRYARWSERIALTMSSVLAKLEPTELVEMDFVGPIDDPDRARVGIGMRERKIVRDARRAMRLDRPIDTGPELVRPRPFDHADLGPRRLVAGRIHLVCRIQGQQSSLVNQDARLRDAFEPDRLLGERLAKGHPARDPFAHELEGHLRYPDESHAMVNSAGAQASLGNFEAAAFAEQDVGGRHPDVGKVNLGVTVGRVIKAKNG